MRGSRPRWSTFERSIRSTRRPSWNRWRRRAARWSSTSRCASLASGPRSPRPSARRPSSTWTRPSPGWHRPTRRSRSAPRWRTRSSRRSGTSWPPPSGCRPGRGRGIVATPVTMPQLGETVIEGTVTRWLKKEGETVARDEPLFEISTDKVDTEVPSPLAGKLVQIKVQEGQTVAVGTELALIDSGGDGQASAAPTEEAEREGQPPAKEEVGGRSEPAEPAQREAPAGG